MESEEELIQKAVVLLNAKLLGVVVGFLMGAGLFLATNFLVIKGGHNVGAHLSLLAIYFPGYSVSFWGSIIGFFYAFVLGFLGGLTLGAVYNKLARA
jgi:hypothetical protein